MKLGVREKTSIAFQPFVIYKSYCISYTSHFGI